MSQIPALRLLMAMGYQYLTPDEALALRGGKRGNVVLEGVLEPWLKAHNQITFKGQTHPFSEANVRRAVEILVREPYDGLIPTSQRVYELLTLGTSLKQTIHGDSKSFSLRYIDWQHSENNVYHVTDEFSVEKRGSHETRRPDVVLFVNGIPLVVIECKRPDLETEEKGKAFEEAVSQMLRNQRDDEIAYTFTYSQLLLAVSVNDAYYATTATPKKFWTLWREQENGQPAQIDVDVHRLINQPLAEADKQRLYGWRKYGQWVRGYFDDLDAAGDRLPTPQDCTLHSLLRPQRLLHLVYQFIVYDGGQKKIARYQQYFAVQETIRRVAHLNTQGMRTGGVVWHTTGSGKSLTMVMLAKALALHPNVKNPRVVIVTDRVNLDAQIWSTFKACGKQVVRARSGRDLARLIRQGKVDIITTVIDKFDTAARQKVREQDANVFVLVDESHRSQYGAIHAKMRQVLPQACYIGFTGTPLLKQEKSTAAKFGGFIHKYSMRQAVADGAVVPLLYEGRMAELAVDQEGIDRWFERVTQGLTDEQKLDLKHKFSRAEEISRAEQRVKQVAFDISDHYGRNFQGHGYKAQLATSNKATALKYKAYLDEFGMVTSEVVISPPDTREGHEEVDNTARPAAEAFWKKMMERFGDEKSYNREILEDFGRADGVEILIVVDKLLVGFDEPRNTVLYVDKPLKEHGLLQAIARVNRLFEGKDFGYIVDYRGVLGELNEAMETYNALEGYDVEDIAGTITDTSAEVAQLPQRHSELWDVFKTVDNKQDVEALQQFLAPEDVRQRFYDALTAYARTLKVALSTAAFHQETPEAQIATYKRDLRFFHNLRTAVKQRYAEAIDYRDYERRVRKLLDSHIQSSDVTVVVEQVNIFDVEAFEAEVAKLPTQAAQADTIAHRVKRTVTENMEKDPAFYRKFSKLIDETIQAYREGRITEAEYLQRVTEAMQAVRTGRDADTPEKLFQYRDAPAFYRAMRDPLAQYEVNAPGTTKDELLADVAIRLEQIIEQCKIRDWTSNPDVQNEIKFAMEEYLYSIKGRHDIPLTGGDMDVILDSVLEVAKRRDRL
ncbi:MAG: restriction endonuclease subunit R [Chloroflexi bacterium]|nr:MAG: restriction endonuclease subunit R [Chloroflexota bacterium]